jgi:hypothetical protein
MWSRAAQSVSWRRPTESIAAGSTSSWPAIGRVTMAPWSLAPGRRAAHRTGPRTRWPRRSSPCASTYRPKATTAGGKVLLQVELERLGIAAKNSRPYHPQTCGKVERLHQTLKRYLANQPEVRTLAGSQEQLDGSPATTTQPGPTGRWVGARPCRPTTPGSRPGRLARPRPSPISESARTRSTPAAPSPFVTTAGCTTSAWAEPTRVGRSSSSWPIWTSVSLTRAPAN